MLVSAVQGYDNEVFNYTDTFKFGPYARARPLCPIAQFFLFL